MKRPDKRLWYSTVIIAIIFVILTFTPLVTPSGKYTPTLFGLPYTLWTGILISLGLVVITTVATFVHPGSEED